MRLELASRGDIIIIIIVIIVITGRGAAPFHVKSPPESLLSVLPAA